MDVCKNNLHITLVMKLMDSVIDLITVEERVLWSYESGNALHVARRMNVCCK